MKIAAIQMCSSHDVDENLAIAAGFIREAASHGAALAVLPEMFAIMGTQAADKITVRENLGQGKIQTSLANLARENNIWIVGGTIPLACDDPQKVRAASLVFTHQGQLAARYDKIHLFDVTVAEQETYQESATTEPGSEIVVVDSPVGKLGLAVCYDIRFPELFRCLANAGAEIMVLPSAFTAKTGEAHWELLTRARAVENLSYVIGACQGGTHSNGRKTYGNSLIVGPWGDIIAKKAGTEPGIIYATIDLESLHKLRASMPVLEHQRIFLGSRRPREGGNLGVK